jgi:uncharacterized protein YegJ (DUF2314 family)
VDLDPRLNEEEKAAARSAGYALALRVEPRSGNVLADRKDLLRFLHAVMGDEGVAVVDHSAQTFWSRAGLEEELAHDAELDIDAIYTMHLLQDDPGPDGKGRVFWLHTHGLHEIGFQDFDVLEPAEDLQGHAHDLLRALAFGTVEGNLAPGAAPFHVVVGQPVQAVPARDFLARAPAADHALYRRNLDDGHLDGHVVVCDPAATGLVARLVRGAAPRPSRFLSGPLPGEVLIPFSHAATELLARRARQMLPVFRQLADELGELECPALVKLGYQVDGGGEDDREHLWFQVHGFDGDTVDATLVNAPFHIARLREGERGRHPLDLLSDWTIMTPFGAVTPRQSKTLRFIRENRDRLRELAAAARQGTA